MQPSMYIYKTCVGKAQLVLFSYVNGLDQAVDIASDHLFFLCGNGNISLILRPSSERYYDYRIVSPLHTVWTEGPDNEDLHVGAKTAKGLELKWMLIGEKETWRAERFPTSLRNGEFSDPFTEHHSPGLFKRSQTHMAQRLRHRIFPGARKAEDVLLPLLELYLDQNLHWAFYTSVWENVSRQFLQWLGPDPNSLCDIYELRFKKKTF
ncbi:hypothetical protein QBC38DRAFT_463388 [Podospora fimiseda]|uniref:Uncharacterized protein n=1 Tax=Podospora fimiseda TaxID=252190 RepID=A0AAN7H2R6_9PEZI|nr:hypothetical protein QBC38DRAFT_463388 [Podospora fimiseda]